MNIFDLQDYKVLDVQEADSAYRIDVETNEQPPFCKQCNAKTKTYRHGKRLQKISDCPMNGKKVRIVVTHYRYKCQECGQTFYEPLPGMNDKRGCTERLVKYIEGQALERTFVSIANETGLDEKTIRNIFHDFINHKEKVATIQTPRILGITEVCIIKPRNVMMDINHNIILDILQDCRPSLFADWLQGLDNHNYIDYVVMPMLQSYKDAVNAILPQARVVVDKHYILQLAHVALNAAWKTASKDLSPRQRREVTNYRSILKKRRAELNDHEQQLIECWPSNLNDLKVAYMLKESLCEIWDSKGKEEAMENLKRWLVHVPAYLEYSYQNLRNSLENWQQEVLTYFDYPQIGSYTKNLVDLQRRLDQRNRGYSFEAVRAKILFGGNDN